MTSCARSASPASGPCRVSQKQAGRGTPPASVLQGRPKPLPPEAGGGEGPPASRTPHRGPASSGEGPGSPGERARDVQGCVALQCASLA